MSISFTITSTGAHCHTGEIYAGYNICSGEEVTIKVEACTNGYLHLENEYKSYQILGCHIGILHIKWFGIMEGYTVMALNLLGLLQFSLSYLLDTRITELCNPSPSYPSHIVLLSPSYLFYTQLYYYSLILVSSTRCLSSLLLQSSTYTATTLILYKLLQ